MNNSKNFATLLIIFLILIIICIILVFNSKSQSSKNTTLDFLPFLQVYHFENKTRLNGGYVIGIIKNILYDCYISTDKDFSESFSQDFSESFSQDFILKYKTKNNYVFNTEILNLIEKYNNIFLKMNIEVENYKWLSFLNSKNLDKFAQIVIEVYGLNNNNNFVSNCFKKLTNTHYLIHMHENNFGTYTNNIPDIIKLTYINKKFFKETPPLNEIPFPILNLDIPNNPNGKISRFDFYPFCSINKKNQIIPKKIYICHKTKEIVEKNSLPKWQLLNPNYKIKCYGDKECRKFLLKNYGTLYLEIFDFIKDPPIKADFWRICIIYKNGGIYADADINPLVPIFTFLEKDTEFLSCTSAKFGNLNPHLIMAIPKHYILKECIETYLNFYKNKVRYGYWAWSICGIMENIMKKYININSREYYDHKFQFISELFMNNNKVSDIYCTYNNTKILMNRHKNYDHIQHIYK